VSIAAGAVGGGAVARPDRIPTIGGAASPDLKEAVLADTATVRVADFDEFRESSRMPDEIPSSKNIPEGHNSATPGYLPPEEQ